MKYGKLTFGQVEAIVNKLGGMEGVKRLLSGELTVGTVEQVFQIWKTIKLGATGLKTAEDFRCALRDGNFRLSDWALDILAKPAFAVATEETTVDLVRVNVAELGFKKGARRDQIYDRARELGLELCPAEVGPQLRLQHKDQPSGEWLVIGMEPITDSVGYLHVFNVARGDSGLWLIADCGHPAHVWDADNHWVFCRPRK